MRSLKLAVLPGASPPGDDAEARLIRASQDGDAEAFARLYGRYRGALYGVCLRRLRDPSLAEDAVQDTFLRAFTNLSRFELGKPIWPWLSSIAERRCIDLHRRGAKTSVVGEVDDAHPGVGGWSEHTSDTTLEAVIGAERRGRLGCELDKLPSRQRRALLLHALEGWNYADIASADRSTVGSVKSLIFRARATLRDACQSGVLGIALLPVRRLRERLHRAAVRVQMKAQSAAEGLLGGGAQALSAGTLALSIAIVGGLPGLAHAGADAGLPGGARDGLRRAAVPAAVQTAPGGQATPAEHRTSSESDERGPIRTSVKTTPPRQGGLGPSSSRLRVEVVGTDGRVLLWTETQVRCGGQGGQVLPQDGPVRAIC